MNKLKDLRSILCATEVNLFLEYKTPIKYEEFSQGDYRPKEDCLGFVDTMFAEYGEFEIEQIYAGEKGIINIDLVDKK